MGKTAHLFTPPGYVTLCGKDTARVRGTWQRGEVTCRECLRIMEANNI